MNFAGGQTDSSMMKELSEKLGVQVAVSWTREGRWRVRLLDTNNAPTAPRSFTGERLGDALRAARAACLQPKPKVP